VLANLANDFGFANISGLFCKMKAQALPKSVFTGLAGFALSGFCFS
jgi:hypothetical protein